MLLLGLLLLGATGAFAGLLVAENRSGGPDYAVTMYGNDLGTVNTLGAFLAYIALTLLFCLALAMVTGGAGPRPPPQGRAAPDAPRGGAQPRTGRMGRRRPRRASRPPPRRW